MLTHPTRDTLPALPWLGRSPGLLAQPPMPEIAAFCGDDRRGRLGARASTAREDRRRQTRWPQAQRRPTAGSAESDWRHPRGVEKARRRRGATGHWGRARQHGRSTGPTGLGPPWLACALGPRACRAGWTVLSRRRPRRLQACPRATGAGRSGQRRTAWANTAGRSLDAWGLAPLRDDKGRALLALLADRPACRAPLVTRQRPVEPWPAALGEPPGADARLDRLVHNASPMAWPGDARRKRQATGPTQALALEGRHAPRRGAP